MRLLTIRARGRAELVRSLEEKGFQPRAAREAAARLEREGWLDDLAAARAAVRARMGRYGRARIARELSARGFSGETSGAVLAELDAAEEEKTLARLFARLWAASARLPAEKRRRRVWNALARRGFAASSISAKMKGSTAKRGGRKGSGEDGEDEDRDDVG